MQDYGPPERWICPDCGVTFDIYPALPFEHVCSSQIRYAPRKVHYFYRGNPTSGQTCFCLTADENVGTVSVYLQNGEKVRLNPTVDGDLTVYHCPGDWNPNLGVDWVFDKRFVIPVKPSEEEAYRQSLRGRHSA